MVTAIVPTKVCPRCQGSGKYSFNLKDGDVCYKCNGSGKVIAASKGQKKIKATCTSLHKAQVADILDIDGILYRVEEIRWIAYKLRNAAYTNQQIKVTGLAENKTFYFKRLACNTDGFAIVTPAEWVGQNVAGKGI